MLTLLRYVVAALLLGPVVTLFALGVVRPEMSVDFIAPPMVFMLGLGGWYLLSRRKIGAAIRFMVMGAWIAVTGIALYTGGIRSPVVVVYPVIILMSGWLDTARTAKLVGALSVLMAVCLFFIERYGWLPHPMPTPETVFLAHQILIYLLSAVLIVFVLHAYTTRLTELRSVKDNLTNLSKELQQSEARYRTLIEWSPEAILVHRMGRILYANPAAIRLFGAKNATDLLRHATVELVHPDCLEEQNLRMKRILNREPIPAAVESRFLRLDGSVIDVQVQGTAIDYDGEPAIHVSIQDITERKSLEGAIRQLAFIDALTNLPNRRLLSDRLTQMRSANRRSGCFSALLFLDLDNFKPLNDTHGHALGDALLVTVATRLKKCVREMDTVARFGGDEFVVLLSELGTVRAEASNQALAIAKKINIDLSRPYELMVSNGAPENTRLVHHCTASIGVVVFTDGQASQEDLLRWADAAMYQAKDKGRNQSHLSSQPDGSETL